DAPTETSPVLETPQPATPQPGAKTFSIPPRESTLPAKALANDYFEIGPKDGHDKSRQASSGVLTKIRLNGNQVTGLPADDSVAGVLRPTILIGLGQFGRAALHWVRQELHSRFGPAGLPIIRCLALDTDPTAPAAEIADVGS